MKKNELNKQTKGKINKNIKSSQLDAKSASSLEYKKSLSPYQIFIKCINRAENLVSFSECGWTKDKCRKNILKEQICDCYRAAIVLSISALDSYIRTVISSKILNKVHNKKNISTELKEYIFSIISQEDLFEAARKDSFFSALERAIMIDFRKQSFQSTNKITSFFELIGYKNIFNNVAKKINIHRDNLIKNLDEYTDRRHLIAHRGDYDLEQTDIREFEITYDYATNCIKTIKNVIKYMNEILEDKK